MKIPEHALFFEIPTVVYRMQDGQVTEALKRLRRIDAVAVGLWQRTSHLVHGFEIDGQPLRPALRAPGARQSGLRMIMATDDLIYARSCSAKRGQDRETRITASRRDPWREAAGTPVTSQLSLNLFLGPPALLIGNVEPVPTKLQERNARVAQRGVLEPALAVSDRR